MKIVQFILKIVNGENIGTLFLASDEKFKNRTRWIILSKASEKEWGYYHQGS